MKKIVKKTVAKKPMMKSGGAKKSLKKYQGDKEGSEVKASVRHYSRTVPSKRAPSRTAIERLSPTRVGRSPISKNANSLANPNASGKYNEEMAPKTSVSSQASASSTSPSFSDKVKLATKRISRNMTNRRAVNLDNRSAKLIDKNKEKSNKLFSKSESLYDKAINKNKEINAFKKEKGFEKSADGYQVGFKKYKKPGAIWSKAQKGGTKKTLKKYQGDVDSSSVKSYENKKILDDQFKQGLKNSREMMQYELNKLKEQEQNRQNTDRLNQMYPNYQIPTQRKGGATKRKMAKGGTKYSANNTGATYQMGYKKGGTVSKVKKVTSRTKKK